MQVPLQDAYAGVGQAETYEVLDGPVNEHERACEVRHRELVELVKSYP